MTLLVKRDLEALSQVSEKPCASIFMPTHRSGREILQDPIRLKNLLGEAEAQLEEIGLSKKEARALLEPIQDRLDDDLFWRYQGDGLAIFTTVNQFGTYRLPLEFSEQVVVGDRFHLKPLLPLLSNIGHFFVLALSQNSVRLFQGTPYTIGEIHLPEVPESLAETMKFVESEKQIQYHTTTGADSGGAAPQRAAVFHGQGGGYEKDEREYLKQFFRQINDGVRGILRDETAPLVLASVRELMPIYREVNDYSYLVEEGIAGNPEPLTEETLQERAWKIVKPYFSGARREALDNYQQLAGTNRTANDIRTIVPAAFYGKVETIFVALDHYQWGHFDPQSGRIELHNTANTGDEDLLDAAAIQTLLKGGTIYALPKEAMPNERPLAALLRYW